VIDPAIHEEVRVSVIATGFEGFELLARRPAEVRRRGRRRAELSIGDSERRELEVSEDEIDVPSFLRRR
jgi:cell division protein FtsZ